MNLKSIRYLIVEKDNLYIENHNLAIFIKLKINYIYIFYDYDNQTINIISKKLTTKIQIIHFLW